MVAHRVFRALAAVLLAAGGAVGLASSAVTVINYTGLGIDEPNGLITGPDGAPVVH